MIWLSAKRNRIFDLMYILILRIMLVMGLEIKSVKYYYSTVDNIIMTFSDIEQDLSGFDEITVRFERLAANGKGFDFAEGKLPNNMFYKTYGFSENDLLQLEKYLRDNAALIWEIAREKVGVVYA